MLKLVQRTGGNDTYDFAFLMKPLVFTLIFTHVYNVFYGTSYVMYTYVTFIESISTRRYRHDESC